MDDDADLVARVRRGDRQAFDDLYDLYADDVFSMCLLILGDPTVARAAAGTAFALVARTRLNPLSDPTRLRSWLLELARGSALAWSGSPQARSIPVPHGVSPEELLAGAVVPAPASLRVGLARTFDRAAVAAVAAASAASRRAAAAAAAADTESEVGETTKETPKVNLVKVPTAPPSGDRYADAEKTIIAATTHSVRVLPLMRMDSDNDLTDAPQTHAGRGSAGWRRRSAVAVAAVTAIAVAGLTAAMNWPTSDAQLLSEDEPNITQVTQGQVTQAPTPDAIRPPMPAAAPSNAAATSSTVVPTVAGAFTSRAASPGGLEPHLMEPIARQVSKPSPSATHRPDPAFVKTPATSPPSSPSTAPAPRTPTTEPPTTTPTQPPTTAPSPASRPTTAPTSTPPSTTPTGVDAPTPTSPPSGNPGSPSTGPAPSSFSTGGTSSPSTGGWITNTITIPLPIFI